MSIEEPLERAPMSANISVEEDDPPAHLLFEGPLYSKQKNYS